MAELTDEENKKLIYVYVVSYGENMDLDYMRILKLEDIESNE